MYCLNTLFSLLFNVTNMVLKYTFLYLSFLNSIPNSFKNIFPYQTPNPLHTNILLSQHKPHHLLKPPKTSTFTTHSSLDTPKEKQVNLTGRCCTRSPFRYAWQESQVADMFRKIAWENASLSSTHSSGLVKRACACLEHQAHHGRVLSDRCFICKWKGGGEFQWKAGDRLSRELDGFFKWNGLGVFKEEECVSGWGHLVVRHGEGVDFIYF